MLVKLLCAVCLCVILGLVAASSKENVALLVPVTSKGFDRNIEMEYMYLFTHLVASLQVAITEADYEAYQISLYLAIDSGDSVYDRKGAGKELQKLFSSHLPRVSFKLLRLDHHSQKIAAIWNKLVQRAFSGKRPNDYFIFLSDDAVVESEGFVGNIVTTLADNNNFGVVAFHEKHKYAKAGSWPTFPCFHRTHLEIFGADAAFDPVFVNSYVDIWISDVYRAFKSDVILPEAIILNTVGGQESPRYNPTFPGWDTYIAAVERGRRRVAAYLSSLPSERIEAIPAMYGRLTAATVDATGETEEEEEDLRFRWSPRELSYGPEGYHYADYCRQAAGCIP